MPIKLTTLSHIHAEVQPCGAPGRDGSRLLWGVAGGGLAYLFPLAE